jgi:serine protease Do
MSHSSRRILGIILILAGLAIIAAVAVRHGALRLPQSVERFFRSSTSTITQDVPLYKPAADYESAVIDAVKKVSPAVVSITISKNLPSYDCGAQGQNPLDGLPPALRQFFGNGGFPGFYYSCDPTTQQTEVGGGSGFIISNDGLILTNKHVAADTSATYTVFTNDGKEYDAKVLGRDPVQDLAVLKIDAKDLPTVILGNSDDLALGQSAISIGNALGEFQNTVDSGVISGLNRSITAVSESGASETIQGVIQTDAAINPGNSGGPLINLRGEVVGVNVAVVQGAQNIGFALPINWAKKDIETVLAGGQIKAPYLGVRYTMITPALAARKSLSVTYGALLSGDASGSAVVKGSPADKAGLKDGDIILSVDGASLQNSDLSKILAGKGIGDTLHLQIQRGKSQMNISVTLGERSG